MDWKIRGEKDKIIKATIKYVDKGLWRINLSHQSSALRETTLVRDEVEVITFREEVNGFVHDSIRVELKIKTHRQDLDTYLHEEGLI